MRLFTYFLVAASFVFLATDLPVAEAARVHGVFRVVKGKVQLRSGKSGKSKRARVGQKVYPRDSIITGKDARAKIMMVDKNEIVVSPDSEITLEKYEYEPGAEKKNVLLNVIYGKVRSKVKQKYNGKTSQFRVKTRSAVAGVRGTDFFASFDSKTELTKVITFEGQVEFGAAGASGQIINPVIVDVGQFTTHKFTENPSATAPPQPMPMPRKEFQQIKTETELENPRFRHIDPRVLPIEPDRDPDSEGHDSERRGPGPNDSPPRVERAMCPPFCGGFDEPDGPGEIQPRPGPGFDGCPGGICGGAPKRDFIDEVVRDGRTNIQINVEDGPRPN